MASRCGELSSDGDSSFSAQSHVHYNGCSQMAQRVRSRHNVRRLLHTGERLVNRDPSSDQHIELRPISRIELHNAMAGSPYSRRSWTCTQSWRRMDIGVSSFRNVFRRIAMRRVALWYLLALSSVPLHLVYNSTIFKTTNSSRYDT